MDHAHAHKYNRTRQTTYICALATTSEDKNRTDDEHTHTRKQVDGINKFYKNGEPYNLLTASSSPKEFIEFHRKTY